MAEKIVITSLKRARLDDRGLNVIKRRVSKMQKGPVARMPSKTELLKAYHSLVKNNSVKTNSEFERLLMRRAVRSLSGVAIVTSLVKPYPCPGQCVYCPLDERMPKSYLSEEPAAARALTLEFSPYTQMQKRLEALEANGHPTDKVELIIKGGTWNAYPLPYQYWFILESFRAANETGKKTTPEKLTETSPLSDLRVAIRKEQKRNETAAHRIIGLTLETRPDCITEKTIWQMREQGCTRLELGVQHTSDRILALTKRGHDLARAKEATRLLKNFGFKTDFHLMPQLPGATPDDDFEMLKTVFSDHDLRPDMIKIYPCTVVQGSELYEWFKAGKYQAYDVAELIRILKEFKATVVPRYCRISRLIRDIPGQYIEEGNTVTNLRELLQRQLAREGRACQCLRCREIGHVDTSKIRDLSPVLFVDEYENAGGKEYFLSFEDKARRVVFAFCRLRVCNQGGFYPAFIRELHTYGQLVGIGKKKRGASQHTGLGKKLLIAAQRIAKKQKCKKIAVISGVGVRGYYRKHGFKLEKSYMVKAL